MFMAGDLEKEDIEYFLAIGAIEFSHINENNEEIYRLTDSAKDIAPHFYETQIKDLNSTVFSLWNKGVLEIFFDDDGNPLISLDEDIEEIIKSVDLDENEHDVVSEILISWEENNK